MKVLSENKNAEQKNSALSECKKIKPSQTIVHAQLEMTTPGDADEVEANAMADAIVGGGKIRRQISNGTNGSGIAVSAAMENQLAQTQGGGRAMPDGLRNMMENGFGRDFSNVRIHTDSQAATMSQNLSAKAFTLGNDIYFNKGQYSPNTTSGQHLIAHELTHVVQGSGKVGRIFEKNYAVEYANEQVLKNTNTTSNEQPSISEQTIDEINSVIDVIGVVVDVFSEFTTGLGILGAYKEADVLLEMFGNIKTVMIEGDSLIYMKINKDSLRMMSYGTDLPMPRSLSIAVKSVAWAGFVFSIKDLGEYIFQNRGEYRDHWFGMIVCTMLKAANAFCNAVGCFPKLAAKMSPHALAVISGYAAGYAMGDAINTIYKKKFGLTPGEWWVEQLLNTDLNKLDDEDVVKYEGYVYNRLETTIKEEISGLEEWKKREVNIIYNGNLKKFLKAYKKALIKDKNSFWGTNAKKLLRNAFVYKVFRKDIHLSYTDYYLLESAFKRLGLY